MLAQPAWRLNRQRVRTRACARTGACVTRASMHAGERVGERGSVRARWQASVRVSGRAEHQVKRGARTDTFFLTIRQAGGFLILVDVDGHFRIRWPAQRHLYHMVTGQLTA